MKILMILIIIHPKVHILNVKFIKMKPADIANGMNYRDIRKFKEELS